jgi:UDP-glucose 4-epimerase
LRYLITGGAGFIGSHLVDALTGRGDDVLVLDDLSTGRLDNIEQLRPRRPRDRGTRGRRFVRDTQAPRSGTVEFVEGCVTDAKLVNDCMESVDACMHLASAVGVKLVVNQPLYTLLRNVRGSDTVLSAAAAHGRRLLFASTSEIYGKNDGEALKEDADRVVGSPQVSRWSYATAKVFGEALAHSYHRQQGSDMVVVRLFNSVGPRQTGSYGMVLPRFVRQALTGEDLTVYGTGTQSRCFTHVLDTVSAILMVAENDDATGQAFNIGQSVPMTIIELAGRVIERADSESKVKLVPYDQAYGPGFEELGRRRPDATALEELTGWRPSRTIDDAIDDVIAHERSAQTQAADLRVVPSEEQGTASGEQIVHFGS